MFDHTFTNIGDFEYYCRIHGADNGNGTASGMKGIVHVQAAVPEPATWFPLAAGTVALGLSRARRRLGADSP
jgi:hypothetical protein